MTHDEVLERIKKERLIAILRGVPMERLDGVVGALVRGGVRILEFTFDHQEPDCVEANAAKIRRAVQQFGDRVLVGCGTALTVQEVEAACDAGACLVISPNVDMAVIRRTRQLDMVSMPGALMTTEEYGFSGVKEARSAPFASLSVTALPALCVPESVSIATPCVSEDRLCAMPDEPAAMTVPPVIVPAPA